MIFNITLEFFELKSQLVHVEAAGEQELCRRELRRRPW